MSGHLPQNLSVVCGSFSVCQSEPHTVCPGLCESASLLPSFILPHLLPHFSSSPDLALVLGVAPGAGFCVHVWVTACPSLVSGFVRPRLPLAHSSAVHVCAPTCACASPCPEGPTTLSLFYFLTLLLMSPPPPLLSSSLSASLLGSPEGPY